MRPKHHTLKPNDYHIPCKTKGCTNYYNAMHPYTYEKCRPCRENDKRKDRK